MMVTADGTFQSVSGPFLLAIEIFTAIINVTYSYRVELGTIHTGIKNKALVVTDLWNDITKNYKKIIGKGGLKDDI